MSTYKIKFLSRLASLGLLIALCLLLLLFWLVQAPVQLAVETCDPSQQPCQTALPNGALLQVQLNPKPLSSKSPISIDLQLSNMTVRGLSGKLTGVNMNMVPVSFTLPSAHSETQLELPICSSGPMDWQVEFTIKGWWRDYLLPYRFRVDS